MQEGERLVHGAGAPGADESERAFVARLQQGDEAAFEELIRVNGRRLLAVARRLLGNDEDARDVFQDAMLAAYRAIGEFAGQARLSTWLHRIVVNRALMKLRTRRRRPEEPLEPLLPVYLADGHHAVAFAEWPGVEQALLRREVREHVRRQIEQLPESYRTVLLLRDIEGLDTREVAKVPAGWTVATVRIPAAFPRPCLPTAMGGVLPPEAIGPGARQCRRP